jgi:Bacterial Ig domain
VQFVLDGTTVLSPLIPGPGATFTYQWNSATVGNGPHTLEVIGKDNLSQTSQSSVTFSVQNGGAPMASAQFVAPADTATQGNWVGKYGSDGFWIANDPSSAPPVYAAVNFSGATNWTWNGSTGDTRALLTSPTGSPGARIASTYFSNTAFTIDLNLNDNQQHAVALYLLDYDDGRSESIQIVDANNPSLVLDSRALSGFQNGEYLVWKIQGHVRIQITNTGGLNAVVSGIFFSTVPSGGQQQPPAVTVTAPTANQQVSGVFKLQATATSTGSVASVQFLVDNSPAGPAITQGVNSTYSYDLDTTSLNNGMHSIKAVAIDNLSQQTTASAVSFSVSNASAGGSSAAVFVRTDTTTQGNWKGVYGSAGEIIANDSNAPPSFAVVNVAGANSFTWTYTSDPRAPLIAASNSNRIASVFYNSPGFSIDLNLTDGNTHQLALYLLDWDGAGRAETITIAAAANPGTILDSRPISGFGNGVYLVWNITGHVKIQVTGSAGPNAVVNALFLR